MKKTVSIIITNFNKDNIKEIHSEPEIKKINPVPEDDPMINSIKGAESSGFKPIHTMNAQDIKNEKIDLIYKFKKLEGQGIRTTMNYNMNSHLEDMRNGIKKAIQIPFELEHYQEAFELVKYWREQGGYVGMMLIEKLKEEKK